MRTSTLITGASGFLGKYIVEEARACNTEIHILGRTIVPETNFIKADLVENLPSLPTNLDLVIHAAGLAHFYPQTEAENKKFRSVNLLGTQNLLKSLEKSSKDLKKFVFISTVAVYGQSKGHNIDEKFPIDREKLSSYGLTKLLSEEIIIDWCRKKNVMYQIYRLPLVLGDNPKGNLGEMISGIRSGRYVKVIGNKGRKSIVFAQDVAKICFHKQASSGTYNLTDCIHPYFSEIEDAIEKRFNSKILIQLPLFILRFAALSGDVIEKITKRSFVISSSRLEKIASTLTFSDSKAKKELSWNPQPCIPLIQKIKG